MSSCVVFATSASFRQKTSLVVYTKSSLHLDSRDFFPRRLELRATVGSWLTCRLCRMQSFCRSWSQVLRPSSVDNLVYIWYSYRNKGLTVSTHSSLLIGLHVFPKNFPGGRGCGHCAETNTWPIHDTASAEKDWQFPLTPRYSLVYIFFLENSQAVGVMGTVQKQTSQSEF